MYRNNIDNNVTYTPDDLDLFRESPFAVWMERLTLENPEHGIPPDLPAACTASAAESPDSIVQTLRAEGRQVVAVDPGLEEPERRAATVAAMQNGVDFIVNGQLSVGAYSGLATLLMRTSGYSDLGAYLYIPCEPEAGNGFHSGFRLSFIANLLQDIQGQLPPQMLIIRDGADVVPLPTEDHIYFYKAVQERFEHAMHTFRKHRMPDPSESSHFGRWSGCASEVLKQRARREVSRETEIAAEAADEAAYIPSLRLATGASGSPVVHDTRLAVRAEGAAGYGQDAATTRTGQEPGRTLADRARMLAPGSFRVGAGPGRTPNLARFPRAGAPEPAVKPAPAEHEEPGATPPGADSGGNDAVTERQNPEAVDEHGLRAVPVWELLARDALAAPPPSLRFTRSPAEPARSPSPGGLHDRAGEESGAPRFLPPGSPVEGGLTPREGQTDTGRARPAYSGIAGVDPDRAPATSLAPARDDARPPGADAAGPLAQKYRNGRLAGDDEDSPAHARPFDDRLNTGADFEDA